ncbi:MAG TPA: outer membrane beta-barrel protein [Thermoanaerobaculaceae bacterium]|nr:outer membrane beta-barrel protein [Thermoanaerobaculaceae bacterium]
MRKALVITICVLAATMAHAQGVSGTVELTPTMGYWFGDVMARGTTNQFDFDVTIDDAPQYGFRLAYRFTDNWALEGFLSRGRADLVTGSSELFGGRDKIGRIDITTGELGFECGFGHSRFVPFVAGGIGVTNLDPDLSTMSSDTRFSGNFGAGFKLFFTPQVALRFDWRGHGVNMGGDHHDDCDWWDDCHNHGDDWLYFKEVALGLTFVF